MAKKFEQALDYCISQLKQGKTIEECLKLYPELKEKLKPYLEIAFEIKKIPTIDLSETFQKALKDRLLAKIKEVVTKPALPRYNKWRENLRRYFMAQKLYPKIAIVVLVLLGLLGGSVYASAKSLPDSPLYPIKQAVENIQLWLTRDPSAKALLDLKFAEKRITEAKAMVEREKPKIVEKVLTNYKKHLDRTLANASKAEKEEVYTRVCEATLNHQEVLAEIYEKVPKPAQEAIKKAIEESMKGQEQALKALSGEKKEEMKKKGLEIKAKVEEKLKKKVIPELPKVPESPKKLESPEIPRVPEIPKIPKSQNQKWFVQ